MNFDMTYRAQGQEVMDDFSLEGEELRDALDKIAGINKMLGGNSLTLRGVGKLLKDSKQKNVTIIDIGCGNGDMLRTLAAYGYRKGRTFTLVGIDANAFTVRYAETLSGCYNGVSYRCLDVFDEAFSALDYDIALCTLTLHHFSDAEIESLLHKVAVKAKIGVVVNDLHRSKTAYRLFKIICFLFRLNRMSREDGLVSIRKGFKKPELEAYSKKLGLKKFTVAWRWAFRYEWIIYNI